MASFCFNGVGVFADKVFPDFVFCGNRFGYLIRPFAAAVDPKHDDLLPVHRFDKQPGRIVRLDQVIEADHFLLDGADLFRRKSLHRSHGRFGHWIFGNPNQNIPTTNVVKVVGKRADAAVNCIRIPAFFELDPVGFDRSGREEVFYVEV